LPVRVQEVQVHEFERQFEPEQQIPAGAEAFETFQLCGVEWKFEVGTLGPARVCRGNCAAQRKPGASEGLTLRDAQLGRDRLKFETLVGTHGPMVDCDLHGNRQGRGKRAANPVYLGYIETALKKGYIKPGEMTFHGGGLRGTRQRCTLVSTSP
jgi:hypothetical protein